MPLFCSAARKSLSRQADISPAEPRASRKNAPACSKSASAVVMASSPKRAYSFVKTTRTGSARSLASTVTVSVSVGSEESQSCASS